MVRKTNTVESSDHSTIESPNLARAAQTIFLEHLETTLEREAVLTRIEEAKVKRAKLVHQASSWKIERIARSAMLSLATLLAFAAIGDAMVPDTPEYMRNASYAEIALFHNETEPVELLALVIPLLGGAAYRRKPKKNEDDDDGES